MQILEGHPYEIVSSNKRKVHKSHPCFAEWTMVIRVRHSSQPRVQTLALQKIDRSTDEKKNICHQKFRCSYVALVLILLMLRNHALGHELRLRPPFEISHVFKACNYLAWTSDVTLPGSRGGAKSSMQLPTQKNLLLTAPSLGPSSAHVNFQYCDIPDTWTLHPNISRCQMQLCPPCNTVRSGHFCICNRVRGYAKTVRRTRTWLYMYVRV